MSELFELAQRNSSCATKTKEDYKEEVFNLIDGIILRASQYKDVTGIFLAQIIYNNTRLYQAMYRETNTPLENEYEYVHGCDSTIICIDDVNVTVKDIAEHYAKLGFLTGIKIFEYNYDIQCRILISWSDEENTDNKVNISKYVNGIDIFAHDPHPEHY